MTTYRLNEVSHMTKRRVTCTVCGKKFNRQRTFTNTINPFNKNASGQPKAYGEVYADVSLMAARWTPEPDCGKHEAQS